MKKVLKIMLIVLILIVVIIGAIFVYKINNKKQLLDKIYKNLDEEILANNYTYYYSKNYETFDGEKSEKTSTTQRYFYLKDDYNNGNTYSYAKMFDVTNSDYKIIKIKNNEIDVLSASNSVTVTEENKKTGNFLFDRTIYKDAYFTEEKIGKEELLKEYMFKDIEYSDGKYILKWTTEKEDKYYEYTVEILDSNYSIEKETVKEWLRDSSGENKLISIEEKLYFLHIGDLTRSFFENEINGIKVKN